jgi:hypothetical protein
MVVVYSFGSLKTKLRLDHVKIRDRNRLLITL